MEAILLKAYWSLADIQTYLGCGRTTASKIKQEAMKLNGGCVYDAYLVKRDSVLLALNLDPERELMVVKEHMQFNKI